MAMRAGVFKANVSGKSENNVKMGNKGDVEGLCSRSPTATLVVHDTAPRRDHNRKADPHQTYPNRNQFILCTNYAQNTKDKVARTDDKSLLSTKTLQDRAHEERKRSRSSPAS